MKRSFVPLALCCLVSGCSFQSSRFKVAMQQAYFPEQGKVVFVVSRTNGIKFCQFQYTLPAQSERAVKIVCDVPPNGSKWADITAVEMPSLQGSVLEKMTLHVTSSNDVIYGESPVIQVSHDAFRVSP